MITELMYSTKDAAYQLDVTVRGIEGWRIKGLLTPVKIDGRCYYPESELKRFLGLPDIATLEYMYDKETVAEVLGVTPHKVERLRKEGKLTALRAGKLWRYPESTINRFLGLSDDHNRSWANENIDEDGNARGELAEARGLWDAPEVPLAA